MTTDFNYGNKTIAASGPFKPTGKDMPSDARTRVETYADIPSIPNPHIGLKITVKADETNNNKMTDYIVKSLKADSDGIANMLIDEVVRYVDYLGASSGGGVSQEDINTAVNNYLTEHPVQSGATVEQAAQIEANRTAIGDENSGLTKEINDIKNTELQNLNTAINTLETVIGDKTGLPSGDANIIASINRIDGKTGSGSGLTNEQLNKLNSIDNKVDKIDGKSLSTNDYTNEEKQTVASLKATVGDTNSGLVKDVKDLKTNGVSQENINTAIENYFTEHPVSGGVTSEQAQNIAQVPTLKSYVDAITIIKDNGKAIKSYEPLATNTLAETGYTNNYSFQVNAININQFCYVVFIYDLTSVLNTSPNEVFKIKFNMPKFGDVTKTDFGCNLSSDHSYPYGQILYGDVFKIENDTELIHNIRTRNIDRKYALFQIGVKADNITDVYGTVSFDYYVNNEVQELLYVGAYASPESITMNNLDVGIMSISNITTIKDKDFEIPFEIKNINMENVEVKLVVDGVEETVSISKVSETSYSIPYNFNTIGTKICSIKITSGATEYSSNNFNIVVKDLSSVSAANIFINPDKILINGNTLSIAITDLENLIKSYSSSLYGKNICFIGDSIIEIDLFCTQLANKTGCKIQNLGVSGSGWIAGGNNFNKRIDLIEGTPDLIVFYGSCNDLNSGDLGKLGDLGTTYYGVVRETLEKVINKYKHTTKYAVITPLPAHYSGRDNRGSFVDSYDTGNSSVRLTQENMSLAQREVAGALSIPCLDLYHNSNCFAIFPDGTVTGDGLHYAGGNIAPVRVIQRFLEGII